MKIGTQIRFPRENGGKQKRKDIIRHNVGPIGTQNQVKNNLKKEENAGKMLLYFWCGNKIGGNVPLSEKLW